MKFQGLGIIMQVEIGITQLAVDGTEHLQILRAHLNSSFKEGDTCSVVAQLTEPLTLQRQLQTGHLHPTADRSRVTPLGFYQGSDLLAEPYENYLQSKINENCVITVIKQKQRFSGCDPQPTEQTSF